MNWTATCFRLLVMKSLNYAQKHWSCHFFEGCKEMVDYVYCIFENPCILYYIRRQCKLVTSMSNSLD